MGNIILLDDATINKIAAGEVIERPASAVKEIMENSIDAGATQITVEIRNGGISYIRVTDNGKGIMPDDMEMAFERHATSKLRTAEDLDEVKTMGFRGEALASIAAIAKVSLLSKIADAENGYEVIIEGGKILSKQEAGCSNGTTITIENLFYNTPVRYKFLKKDFTESGYIEDAVTRIALVHPEIAIKLINSGKTVIQTSGNGDIKAVIYNIYGKEVASNLINIDYQYEDLKVQGVIGKPDISRSNRANQLFFVNKRFVKDKTLSSAAEQAFKGFVTMGRHGFLVLNLEMQPEKVDVNVHPAKLEVRFQEENKVFKAIYHAIKAGIENTGSFENINREQIKINANQQAINENYSTNFIQSSEINFENKKSNIQEDTEKKNEQAFESVMERIKKMQNMIKMVQNDTTGTNDDFSQANKFEAEYKEIKKEMETNVEAQSKENSERIEQILNKQQEEQTIEEDTKYTKQNYEKTEQNREQTDLGSKIDRQNITTEKTENLQEPKNAYIASKTNDDSTLIKNEIDNITNNIEKNNIVESEKQEKRSDPEFLEMYEKTFGLAVKKKEEKEENNIATEFKPVTGNNMSIFENVSKFATKPIYKFIGVAFNSYMIIEMSENLYIIDKKAANARIIYEKLKKNYYENQDEKNSQLMLLPDVITLTNKQMGIYKDNIELFKKAGFTVEEFGENTVKLSGVPEVLIELENKEIFVDILDKINTVARTAHKEIEEKFISTIANKATIQMDRTLDNKQAEKILDNLLSLSNPFTYSDGSTIAIKMTKYDIEKKFSRIQ